MSTTKCIDVGNGNYKSPESRDDLLLIDVAPARGCLRSTTVLYDGYERRFPNPLVYLNASKWHDIPSLRRMLDGYSLPAATFAPVVFGAYQDTALVDPSADFLTIVGSQIVLEQLSQRFRQDKDALEAAAESTLTRAASAALVDIPCVLVARFGETTWGHWLWEMLPKIVITERMRPSHFTYVVPAGITLQTSKRSYSTSILESLAAYGIGPDRLIRLIPNYVYSFSQLHDIVGCFQYGMHADVWDEMRSICSNAAGHSESRIAVLRGPEQSRNAYNYEEVAAVLTKNAFEQVSLPTISFLEQVRLFSNANVIAGDLGSNLAGLLYSAPNLKLITFSPSGWSDGYFIPVSKGLQCCHADVRGPSTLLVNSGIDLSPYTVDVDDVQCAISTVLEYGVSGNDRVTIDGRSVPRCVGATVLDCSFEEGGSGHRYRRTGWYAPESRHTWSEGNSASLSFEGIFLSPGDYWLEVEGISVAVDPYLSVRPMEMYVNDQLVLTTNMVGRVHAQALIPSNVIERAKTVAVRFELRLVPSPRDLGLSNDTRRLGLGLERLRLSKVAFRMKPQIGIRGYGPH